jgi:hypothetical protein
MESQKIKDNRRAKFLAKLESQNKANKKEKPKKAPTAGISQPNSQINLPQTNIQPNPSTNIPSTQTIPNVNNNINDFNINNMMNSLGSLNNILSQNVMNNQQKNVFNNNNIVNNNLNNNGNNNNDFKPNNQGGKKFNYNEIIEKLNQIDYMINFQSVLKKILLIILSIIHCLQYQPLDNGFVLKYTLIVLEISSLLFNKYYNDQKKNLSNNYNNNTFGQPPDQIEKIAQFIKDNFGIFNQAFFIIIIIKDIFVDIAIMFIINVLFFLMNSNE